MTSHEAACSLNTGDQDARVRITAFFADREPVGPYTVSVPARHTRHVRFTGLNNPAPVRERVARPQCAGFVHVIRIAATGVARTEHLTVEHEGYRSVQIRLF